LILFYHHRLMSVLELCQWIQDSQLATGIRESGYVFPFLEGAHVIALSLSVGVVMWFDLRLMGVSFRKQPVSQVFTQLKPWMIAGFSIMFVSGALLFSSLAVEAYANSYFRIKIGLLLLAGANMLLFHLTIDRHRTEWDKAPIPPLQARLAGLASLLLFMGVIIAGRLFAYAV
jgi:hypothetical protein